MEHPEKLDSHVSYKAHAEKIEGNKGNISPLNSREDLFFNLMYLWIFLSVIGMPVGEAMSWTAVMFGAFNRLSTWA